MERDIIFIISKPKRIVILVLSYILICSGCYTETREVEIQATNLPKCVFAGFVKNHYNLQTFNFVL